MQKIDHEGRDSRDVLHGRVDAIWKQRARLRAAGGALAIVRTMFGDDERRRLGQIKHLSDAMANARFRVEAHAAHRAGLRVMIDDGVGISDLSQCLAFVTLLPARFLAGTFAQARHPRRLLQPIARRWLAAVRTVQFEPALEFGEPRFQSRIFSPQRRNQRDQVFLGRLAWRFANHPILESKTAAAVQKNLSPIQISVAQPRQLLKNYRIKSKGRKLVLGLSIGEAVVAGRACLIDSPLDIDRFVNGAILVTRTTDPDWVPIMKRAAAIITDHGGRTSHAAIVSRELGVPAVVGTGNATHVLHDEQEVTVSCAEGDEGFIYEGTADFEAEELDLEHIPTTRTQVMLNLANPAAAFRWWRLPADGVGLARMEFVVSNHIKVHPMALVHFDRLEDQDAKRAIAELTQGYADKTQYFVDRLARGLARIAAAHYPKPVIVRMSDFKTNEYANLIGGMAFEPKEENPMLGFRGASR